MSFQSKVTNQFLSSWGSSGVSQFDSRLDLSGLCGSPFSFQLNRKLHGKVILNTDLGRVWTGSSRGLFQGAI